jgi:ABC-2 type transport system permease protein
MRNIWLVIRHEIGKTLRTRSFWLMTFLVPALLLAVQVYYVIQDNGLDNRGGEDQATAEQAEDNAEAEPSDIPLIGLVDDSGLITEIPQGIPPGMFVRFPDEATARAALDANDIDQYVYIPADYIATGQVTVYDKNFQIREGGEDMGIAFQSPYEWVLGYLINANLTGDAELVATLNNPVPGRLAERHVLRPPEEKDVSDQALGQVVATVIPYIFYFIFLVGTGYLMRSVVAEKENRTAEVLLLSLHPRELMIGKILGLGAVTLVQMVIWFGGGMLMLEWGAEWLNLSAYTFPPGFILWAALFLLLGFLLYASVMAAAGAMATNAREGGQVTWLLIIPLMPTLMFGSLFFEEPNGTLPLVLSLFPFSAPSAMVTRLAITEVPLWQLLVSLLGLAGTTYLMVSLSARFFRAGNLLSQAAFDWRRFVTGWKG